MSEPKPRLSFRDLVGRTITAVHLDVESFRIKLEDNSVYEFWLDADCCSTSYFHEARGITRILNKPIVEVDTIDLEESERNECHTGECSGTDCVKYYGIRIGATPLPKMIKGIEMEISQSMFIDFRNDSNGYYGGSLTYGRLITEYDDEWFQPEQDSWDSHQ